MTENPQSIESLDWRYRAATVVTEDHLGPGGQVLAAKGTPITATTFVNYGDKKIGFGDPSATALFLNQSHKAYIEAMRLHPYGSEWLPRTYDDATTRVFDYLEAICASIIFAYAALEAFVNEELPEDHVFERQEQRSSGIHVVRQFDKEQIQRHLRLDEKLATVLPRATGKPSPKGTSIWEGFVRLRKLRDRVVHLKSEDRKRSNVHDLYPKSIWSDLLSPGQLDFPAIAKSMILHFKHDDKAYWVKRCPF